MGILKKSFLKTVSKFKNNTRPFGPSKCPVYVRMPSTGYIMRLWFETSLQLGLDFALFTRNQFNI